MIILQNLISMNVILIVLDGDHNLLLDHKCKVFSMTGFVCMSVIVVNTSLCLSSTIRVSARYILFACPNDD